MKKRTLRLQMKRGMAILKECNDLPLKENMLLHTNEYTFFCNATTFNRVAGMHLKRKDNPEQANAELEEFFTKTAQAANITGLCFDLDQALDDVKAELLTGQQTGNYSEHWEPERDENILRMYQQRNLQRKAEGREKLQLFTAPDNMYKALVDPKTHSVEFIQFEEAMSALKQKNVMAEHININRRPMYILHKLLALVMYIRDHTGERTWGE